ncbi:Rib/alpha-like domain-containing protein [Limosilactobacillus caccae]|uniref:Rib/alpha-like domain-containing protein n=1 Tax=Limosilactobacillus caccae TaxID=1926284 RepID=UPI000970539B|nr:Rib/alpha-like domain-containing protein [Limosilactobacillus caccae]
MLSKNNRHEQFQKQEPKKQRFAIKKLTVGVASVLIGFSFMGLNASANADDGSDDGAQPTPDSTGDDELNNASNHTAVLSTAANTNFAASQAAQSAEPTNTDIDTKMADEYQQKVAEIAAMTNPKAREAALNNLSGQTSASADDASETADLNVQPAQSQAPQADPAQLFRASFVAVPAEPATEVSSFADFSKAFMDPTVHVIKLTKDIDISNLSSRDAKVDGGLQVSGDHELWTGKNGIARDLTIEGADDTNATKLNLGKWYIATNSKDNNQVDRNDTASHNWNITYKNLDIVRTAKDVNQSASSQTQNEAIIYVDSASKSNNVVNFDNVNIDLKNSDLVSVSSTSQNVTVNIDGLTGKIDYASLIDSNALVNNVTTIVNFSGQNEVTDLLNGSYDAILAKSVNVNEGADVKLHVGNHQSGLQADNTDKNNIIHLSKGGDNNVTFGKNSTVSFDTVHLSDELDKDGSYSEDNIRGINIQDGAEGKVILEDGANVKFDLAAGHSIAAWVSTVDIQDNATFDIKTKFDINGHKMSEGGTYDKHQMGVFTLGTASADGTLKVGKGATLKIVRTTRPGRLGNSPLISYGDVGIAQSGSHILEVGDDATIDLQDNADSDQGTDRNNGMGANLGGGIYYKWPKGGYPVVDKNGHTTYLPATDVQKTGMITMWGHSTHDYFNMGNVKYINFERTGQQFGSLFKFAGNDNFDKYGNKGANDFYVNKDREDVIFPFAQWNAYNNGDQPDEVWQLKYLRFTQQGGDPGYNPYFTNGQGSPSQGTELEHTKIADGEDWEVEFANGDKLAVDKQGNKTAVIDGQTYSNFDHVTDPDELSFLNDFNPFTAQRWGFGSKMKDQFGQDGDKYKAESQDIAVSQNHTLDNNDAQNAIKDIVKTTDGTVVTDAVSENNPYTWDANNTPDTTTPGDKTGKVIVSYKDGTKDTVQVNVTVNATPTVKPVEIHKGETPAANDGIANLNNGKTTPQAGYPTNADWAKTPDTTKTGVHYENANVHYQKGDDQPVAIPVIVTDPANQTAIANENGVVIVTSQPVVAHKTSDKEVAGADKAIDHVDVYTYDENHKLVLNKQASADATATWATPVTSIVADNGSIATEAEKADNINVTFKAGTDAAKIANGKTVSVPAKVTLYGASKNDVTVVHGNAVPDPSSLVDTNDLTEAHNAEVKNVTWNGATPSTDKVGTVNTSVSINFADGSKLNVPVSFAVTNNNADDNTPATQNISTPEGVTPQAPSVVTNKPSDNVPTGTNKLPAGTTVTWTDEDQVKNDVKTPGEHTEDVTVTYPDGTTDKVTTTVTVDATPTTKPLRVDEGSTTTDPTSSITNIKKDEPGYPSSASWKDGNGPDATKPGKQDTTVTVHYPDGTTQDVTVPVVVTEQPQVQPIKPDDKGNLDPSTAITNLTPDGSNPGKPSSVTWKTPGEKPTEPGIYNPTVVVTYPKIDGEDTPTTVETTIPVIVPSKDQVVISNDKGAVIVTTDPAAVKAHETSDKTQLIDAKSAIKSIDAYKIVDGKISTDPENIATSRVKASWATTPDTTVTTATAAGKKISGASLNIDLGTTARNIFGNARQSVNKTFDITAAGAEAKDNSAKPVAIKLGSDLTKDQFSNLVNNQIPTDQIASTAWQTKPTKGGDGVIRITFTDKNGNAATYLDVKIDAKNMNVSGDADNYDPTTKNISVPQNDPTVPDAKTTVTNKAGDPVQPGVTNLPKDTKIDWTNPDQVKDDIKTPGSHTEQITVTYPDGTKDTVTTDVIVNADPTVKPIAIHPGDKPAAKDGIGNLNNGKDTPQDGYPSEVDWTNGAPDTTKPGVQNVEATVKYPSGDTTTVNIPVIITDPNTQNVVANDKGAVIFTTQPVVTHKTTDTNKADAAKAVKAVDVYTYDQDHKLVLNSSATKTDTAAWQDNNFTSVVSGNQTATIKDQGEDVTLTFADGSDAAKITKSISAPTKVTLNGATAKTGVKAQRDVASSMPKPSDLVDTSDLTAANNSEVASVDWQNGQQPSLATKGQVNATVTVTFTDGSHLDVPVTFNVGNNDADNYTPATTQTIATPEGTTPKAPDAVTNESTDDVPAGTPKLPEGTKVTWTNPDKVAEDVKTPGSHTEEITVTYPDGSKDTTTTTVVANEAPKVTPISVDKGKTPDATKAITNLKDNVPGYPSNIEWIGTPDTSKVGPQNIPAKVTYPNGDPVEVTVPVVVIDPSTQQVIQNDKGATVVTTNPVITHKTTDQNKANANDAIKSVETYKIENGKISTTPDSTSKDGITASWDVTTVSDDPSTTPEASHNVTVKFGPDSDAVKDGITTAGTTQTVPTKVTIEGAKASDQTVDANNPAALHDLSQADFAKVIDHSDLDKLPDSQKVTGYSWATEPSVTDGKVGDNGVVKVSFADGSSLNVPVDGSHFNYAGEASEYAPSYADAIVKQGETKTVDVNWADDKKPSDGVTYSITPGKFNFITIDEHTGKITYAPTTKTPVAPYFVPVTIHYGDGSTETVIAHLGVTNSSTSISFAHDCALEAKADDLLLHNTTGSEMDLEKGVANTIAYFNTYAEDPAMQENVYSSKLVDHFVRQVAADGTVTYVADANSTHPGMTIKGATVDWTDQKPSTVVTDNTGSRKYTNVDNATPNGYPTQSLQISLDNAKMYDAQGNETTLKGFNGQDLPANSFDRFTLGAMYPGVKIAGAEGKQNIPVNFGTKVPTDKAGIEAYLTNNDIENNTEDNFKKLGNWQVTNVSWEKNGQPGANGNFDADHMNGVVRYDFSDGSYLDIPVSFKTGDHITPSTDGWNDETHKDVTRKIVYDVTGTNHAAIPEIDQTVSYTRDGYVKLDADGNPVKGADGKTEVIWNNWKLADGQTATFPGVDEVTQIHGYDSYINNDKGTKVNAEDVTVTKGEPQDGATVTVSYQKQGDIPVPADDTHPANKEITRTITFEGVPSDKQDAYKNQTQTVKFTRADKNGNIGHKDAVTGEVTYNPWTVVGTESTWASVDAPTITEDDGAVYTPAITIDGQTAKSIDAVTVNPGDSNKSDEGATKNSKVTVVYTETTTPHKYTDGDGKTNDDSNLYVTRTIHYNVPAGQAEIADQVQTVHYIRKDAQGNSYYTDQDGKKTYADWTLADGQSAKWDAEEVNQIDNYDSYVDGNKETQVSEQAVTSATKNVTVEVTYQDSTETVTPGEPGVTPVDPANPEYKNLFKTVTRTIEVQDPATGEYATKKTETVTFGRTGEFDKATGKFIQDKFGAWKIFDGTKLTDSETGTWAAYPVEKITDDKTGAEWTPSITIDGEKADAITDKTVHATDGNSTVKVSYTETTTPVPYQKGQDGVTDEMDEYITRTITVNYPESATDKTQPAKQVVHYTRKDDKGNAGYIINGEKKMNDWQLVGSDTWSAYTAPEVKGYTANKSVEAKKVAATDSNETVEINYIKNGSAGVKADDKNPATKDITRTIKSTGLPAGYEIADQTQTVQFTREDAQGNIGYKDPVTDQVTYNDWKLVDSQNGEWKAVTVNPVTTDKGAVYTPEIDGKVVSEVPAKTVSASDENTTVTVNYAETTTPVPYNKGQEGVNNDSNKYITRTITDEKPAGTVTKKETVHFSREDDKGNAGYKDSQGKITWNDWHVVGDDTWDAYPVAKITDDKTGAEWTPTITVDGQKANSIDEVTVQSGDKDNKGATQDSNVTITYTATKVPVPYTPGKDGQNDESNHYVTRTIHYNVPAGQNAIANQVQTVHYIRKDANGNAGYKDANGKFTPVEWTLADGQSAMWATQDVAQITNYDSYVDGKKSTQVAEQTVTAGTQNVTVEVTYQDSTETVTPGENGVTPDNPDYKDLFKTVTRTINVKDPSTGKVTTEKVETVTFGRTGTFDKATNKFVDFGTYHVYAGNKLTDSETGTWAAYTAPEVAGYTADKTVEAKTVAATDSDETIELHYTAGNQSMNYIFVDDTNNGAQVGTAVNYSGDTNTTVDVSLTVPAGYKLADGQSLPTSYTFTSAKDQQVKIHVVHATKTVDEHNIPTGYSKDDFAKEITRTITAHVPAGDQDLSQHVTIHRTGTLDEATGKIVSWNPWSKDSFAAVDAPTVKGYTPDKATVEAETNVTDGYNDPKIEINYTKNDNIPVKADDKNPATKDITRTIKSTGLPAGYEIADQTQTVKFTREDAQGNIGYQDPVTDQVTYNDWKLVDSNNSSWKAVTASPVTTDNGAVYTPDISEVPAKTVAVTDSDTTVTVKYTETTTPVPYEKGQDGVTDEMDEYITRTITVNYPASATDKTQPAKQVVHYTRADEKGNAGYIVNGVKKMNDWKLVGSDTWAAYTAPEVAGYTADKTVEAKTVAASDHNETVEINYNHNRKVVNPGDVKPGDKTKAQYKDMFGSATRTIHVNMPDGSSRTLPANKQSFERSMVMNEATGMVDADFTGTIDGVQYTNGYSSWTPASAEFTAVAEKNIIHNGEEYVATVTGPTAKGDNIVPAMTVAAQAGDQTFDYTVNYNLAGTDAANYHPAGKPVETTKGQTPAAKAGIDNPDELPTGTTYTWKTTPDVSVPGTDVPAIVVVHYPDQTTDEVATTIHVTSDAEQNTPQPKVITVNPGKTPQPEDGIGNKPTDHVPGPKLPDGTTYTWKDGKTPDTTTPGDKPATIVVHYPDGSQDEVPTTVHVNTPDADKYSPAYPEVVTTPGKTTTTDVQYDGDKPSKGEVSYKITDGADVPTWVTVDPSTGTITTDVPADTTTEVITIPVTVTYNDGSQDQTSSTVVIVAPKDQAKNPTTPKDTIKNPENLPGDTTVDWKPGDEPDPHKKGDQPTTVVVTVPGHDPIEVPTVVNYGDPTDADKNTPETKPVSTPQGELPDAGEAVTNKPGDDVPGPKLPDGTTVNWTNPDKVKDDTKTPGTHPEEVTVHYPDGSEDKVTVDVTANEAPQTQAVNTIIGKVPEAADAITNLKDNVPGYPTSAEWTKTPDVSKPGNSEGTIKVTYPDGSSVTIEVPVTVRDTTRPLPYDSNNSNMNREVSRTIEVVDPVTGKTTTTVQTVQFTRDGEEDVATGEITYNPWQPARQTLSAVTINTIKGYTTHVDGDAGEMTVTPETADLTVTISYDANKPEGKNITANEGSLPAPSTAIKNPDDLPDGTKYDWKQMPDTNTPGEKKATVVATLPGGAQVEVPVTVTVQPSDADKYNPEAQQVTTPNGQVPNASETIKNLGDLPTGTTVEWTNPAKVAQDVKNDGTHTETVTVTYPDGSKENVTVPVNAVTPQGHDLSTVEGELPAPATAIVNQSQMPDGTRYVWKQAPDVNTLGDSEGIVEVIFPSGSTVDVPVNVHVIANANARGAGEEDGNKSEQVENATTDKNDNSAATTAGNSEETAVQSNENTGKKATTQSDKNNGNQANAKKLPQTGNDGAESSALAGLGLASLAGILGLGKKKKRDTDK